MPDLRAKVCGAPGCYEVVAGGYCPTHKRERRRRDDRSRSDSRAKYNDARWKRYSVSYRRRHPVCAYCLEEQVTPPKLARVVDHIIPVELGGSMWDPENHQGLCHPHHNGRKQREDNELRKRLAAEPNYQPQRGSFA